ncbi:hypothetical protein S14_103 [Shewanella sp. phage 1/4]|uniref:hypothetical protein n=1 Tax=Shewanella phage 1/4 TaxID=1458859 RepID=UPI0004F7D635|nr:hypothetical protein S14_103 [Shewanella sp. phage 1/4]AHK11212.1 hypothetical protein S14_103 [Shewanella sp. phage 1/4]
MNKLIQAYLIHTNHYLAGAEVQTYYAKVTDDNLVYKVSIENECCFRGCEIIYIQNEELLTFLFELTLKQGV